MRCALTSFLVGASLLLAACASTPTDAKLAATCQGYASTLSALAQYKDRLDEEQKLTVNSVRAAVNPVCYGGKNVSSYADALVLVTSGLQELAEVHREVKQ